jgi:hypothetical protein
LTIVGAAWYIVGAGATDAGESHDRGGISMGKKAEQPAAPPEQAADAPESWALEDLEPDETLTHGVVGGADAPPSTNTTPDVAAGMATGKRQYSPVAIH